MWRSKKSASLARKHSSNTLGKSVCPQMTRSNCWVRRALSVVRAPRPRRLDGGRSRRAWYTLEQRNNQPRIGWVLIARGRDASDVAISTSFGTAELLNFVVVTEEIVGSWTWNRDSVIKRTSNAAANHAPSPNSDASCR